MAVMMSMIFSDRFKGFGVGGSLPYYASRDLPELNSKRKLKQICRGNRRFTFIKTGILDVIKAVRKLAKAGQIAPLSNLKNQKNYVYAAESDWWIKH